MSSYKKIVERELKTHYTKYSFDLNNIKIIRNTNYVTNNYYNFRLDEISANLLKADYSGEFIIKNIYISKLPKSFILASIGNNMCYSAYDSNFIPTIINGEKVYKVSLWDFYIFSMGDDMLNMIELDIIFDETDKSENGFIITEYLLKNNNFFIYPDIDDIKAYIKSPETYDSEFNNPEFNKPELHKNINIPYFDELGRFRTSIQYSGSMRNYYGKYPNPRHRMRSFEKFENVKYF
jgi:hypothetical protein